MWLVRKFISVIFLVLCIAGLLFLPLTRGQGSVFRGDFAYQQVRYLVENIGPRPTGSQNEYAAGEFIASTLRRYGWTVSFQDFSRVSAQDKGNLKKYSLINSRNVIGILPGHSGHSVIIGAHYDSADFNVPGADDNASGVGVLLELARVLPQLQREDTYILVGFGAEEAGLIGSRYFVDHYNLANVRCMINLDMVGEGNRIAIDGGGKVSTPQQLLQNAYSLARKSGLIPEVRRDFMLLARDSLDGGSSDFSPFLDKGIPAIGLGQGGKTPYYYHQPEDGIQHVNQGTLKAYGDLVLEITARTDWIPAGWQSLYIPFDLHISLVMLPAAGLKLFVAGSILLAIVFLIRLRRKEWVSLGWLIPGFLLISGTAVLFSFLPEAIIGKLHASSEPWYAHPGLYLMLRLTIIAGVICTAGLAARLLPRKLLPLERDVYWAGSILLLSLATVVVAISRWDYAFYIAFWLMLVIFSRFRHGWLLCLGGPYFFYSLHWQLLNSYLWIEFYRSFSTNPAAFSLIYGAGLVPFWLSLTNPAEWKHVRIDRCLQIISTTSFVLMLACSFLPSYTKQAPQNILIREQWLNHQLDLTATSTDVIPVPISSFFGGVKAKTLQTRLNGASEPLAIEVKPVEVKMNSERMLTVDVNLDSAVKPYLLKVKLRGEQPFTLVSGGEFFPISKLPRKIKLEGVPVGGIYGLVLERTMPMPQHFVLYLKAKGPVRLSIEAQYPEQFLSKKFSCPNTSIKYENWVNWTNII